MYRDTTNVEAEMDDCTIKNWSHWNSNEKLKEKFGNCTRKTFDRFTTKDSYIWNITHNTESTALCSLKPERWGSPLVHEKYQEEKACDKRHPYHMMMMMMMIIIIIIIIRDHEKRTDMLIDVAISGDGNVIKKGAQKILKYKDLTIEIQRMWNVKSKVIPVIIEATGTVSKSFRIYVNSVPGKHEVKELQKTAILGTAHILRKVLM